MIRYATLFAFGLLSSALLAQTHNALDLDGVDDQVVDSNAYIYVDSDPVGLALGCWVRPRIGWDGPGGVAGFQGGAEGDLYLIAGAPGTRLEGHFRNDEGAEFVVVMDGLEAGVWQYVTLNYSGTDLSLYKNGVAMASVPANGMIITDRVDLRIGNIPLNGADRMFNGTLDEITLWRRSLLAEELPCIMQDLHPLGLEVRLNFKCDQGMPAGYNVAVPYLFSAHANDFGRMTGFALTGNTSNFVEGVQRGGGTLNMRSCGTEQVYVYGEPMDSPSIGDYWAIMSVVLDQSGGCDSIVTVIKRNIAPDPGVVVIGDSLISLDVNGPYQWLDCGNAFAPVAGATEQVFVPTDAGSYAVQVPGYDCTSTSACYSMQGTGVARTSMTGPAVVPCPVFDRLKVSWLLLPEVVQVRILDLHGREVMRRGTGPAWNAMLDVAGLPAGIYVLLLDGKVTSTAARFVKD